MPHHLDCQLLPSTKQASLYSLKCHVSKKNVTQEKLYLITVKIFTFSYANYHCENTQLATHPIDIVKQCVAVRIQLKRVAHSNEDCRGKKKKHKTEPPPQQRVRPLDRLSHKKCSENQVGLLLHLSH